MAAATVSVSPPSSMAARSASPYEPVVRSARTAEPKAGPHRAVALGGLVRVPAGREDGGVACAVGGVDAGECVRQGVERVVALQGGVQQRVDQRRPSPAAGSPCVSADSRRAASMDTTRAAAAK